MNSTNGPPARRPRAGMRSLVLPEVLFAFGQSERLAHDRLAALAALGDEKLAEVRHQHDAVGGQVFTDLRASGDRPHVRLGPLGFDCPPRGQLSFFRLRIAGLLELLRGEETASGQIPAAVGQVDDATDLGFERLADLVEEVREGRIVGRFRNSRSGGMDVAEFPQVSLQGGSCQFCTKTGGGTQGRARSRRRWVFPATGICLLHFALSRGAKKCHTAASH